MILFHMSDRGTAVLAARRALLITAEERIARALVKTVTMMMISKETDLFMLFHVLQAILPHMQHACGDIIYYPFAL